MKTKKIGLLSLAFISLAFLMLLISFASASLDIKKSEVSVLAIKDLNKPAIFNLEITNNGEGDIFNIYSIAGVRIEPSETFTLAEGETKTIQIKVYSTIPLKVSPDYYSFEYKIKGQKMGIQKDELVITIVNLKDAFNLYVDPINPDSTTAKAHIENKYGAELNNIDLELSSIFFSTKETFSFSANEKKEFEVPINEDKLRSSLAGPYIVNAVIKAENITGTSSFVLRFEEKPGIETKELREGFLAKRLEIEKFNKGNLKTSVEVITSKNLFASFFTSVNPSPARREISRFHVTYIFQEELSPGETLKVVIKTNWWILVIIIVAIVLIYYFIDNYLRNKLVLKKTISFVKTKGGEFALRINIHVKARNFVERIRIIDRLPPMVKVFEKYGLPPDQIDEKSRRLEWNLQALAKGEERTLNYIIYSKVGVVGKFELPQAEAIYEFNGKIKEAQSNRAFIDN